MADKLRVQQQLEATQNKYVGTGHSDSTVFEWRTNIARDSYSSIQGHPSLLLYTAVAMGSSVEAVRAKMMESMVLPCGPAPRAED